MTRRIDTKTSTVLDRQIPEYVRENFGLFVSFLKQYYDWLDSDQNVNARIKKLIDQRQVAYSDDPYTDHLLNDFLVNIPKNLNINYALLIKNIKAFYGSKGTEAAIRYFFDIFRSLNDSFTFYVNYSGNTDNLEEKTFTGSLSGSRFTIVKAIKIDASRVFIVVELSNSIFPESGDVIVNVSDSDEFYSTIISNFKIDINYPKIRILRSSNGIWQNSILIIVKSNDELNLSGRGFTSSINSNIGFVETQNLLFIDSYYYYQLKLSFNEFIAWASDENIIVDDIELGCSTVCSSTNVLVGGTNYRVGDEFNIKSGSEIVGKLKVKSTSRGPMTKVDVEYGGYNYEIGDEIVIGDHLGLAVVSELGALNAITKVQIIYSHPEVSNFQTGTISSTNGYDADLIFYGDTIGNIKELNIVDSGTDLSPGGVVEIPSRSLIEIPAEIELGLSTLRYTEYSFIGDSGFLDGSDKLQDNYYYQDYSYEIKSETRIDYSSLIDFYKKLVHPAGTKVFFTSINNTESTLVPRDVSVSVVYSYKYLVIFSYGYKRFVDFSDIDFSDTFKSLSLLRINTFDSNLLTLPLIYTTSEELYLSGTDTIEQLIESTPKMHRYSMQPGHKDTIIQII